MTVISRTARRQSRAGWSSFPGRSAAAFAASISNAAIRADVRSELTGSTKGMPSTSAWRPDCCFTRRGIKCSALELVEHLREHVAARVLADEDVEMGVVGKHVQRMLAGRVLLEEP